MENRSPGAIIEAVSNLIEATEAGYREFNAGDVEALSARLAPGFQWNEASEIAGPKSCASREEFVHFMRGFPLLWDEFRFEPLELEPGSHELIYARVRASGRGRASEEAVEFVIHHVWRVENGLYARMDAYLDEHEAREAAGLTPG